MVTISFLDEDAV